LTLLQRLLAIVYLSYPPYFRTDFNFHWTIRIATTANLELFLRRRNTSDLIFVCQACQWWVIQRL